MLCLPSSCPLTQVWFDVFCMLFLGLLPQLPFLDLFPTPRHPHTAGMWCSGSCHGRVVVDEKKEETEACGCYWRLPEGLPAQAK